MAFVLKNKPIVPFLILKTHRIDHRVKDVRATCARQANVLKMKEIAYWAIMDVSQETHINVNLAACVSKTAKIALEVRWNIKVCNSFTILNQKIEYATHLQKYEMS